MNLLRAEPAYRRLLFASLLSGIGDWFNSVALLSLLLHLTGSSLSVGIALAVRTFPYLVMGPLGGILADRLHRKTILLFADFSRFFIALALLLVHAVSQVWIAYVATAGLVVFSALFSPARTAVIPQLVHPQHLAVANALEQSLGGFVMAFGAGLGGLISARFGFDTAFAINAISFLASGFICWSINLPNLPNRDPGSFEGLEEKPQRIHSLASSNSFWFVFRQSRLIQLVCVQAILWAIGGGAINTLLSVYGYQVFHSGNWGVGVLYGALGIGFLASGFFASRLVKRLRIITAAAYLFEGICHVAVSLSPVLWGAAILLSFATMSAGIGNAVTTTLLMREAPTVFHGRVFSLLGTISSVVISLSMLATGFLLDVIPARTIGFWAGSFMVFTSFVTGFALVRMKDTAMNPHHASI